MDSLLILELTSMIDPRLEEEIGLIKRCMDSLKRFHDVFDNAILTETVVPEDEVALQELRATLPLQYKSLLERVGLRPDSIMDQIAEIASSLSTVILLTDFQRRKLYDLWHKGYTKLNFLLGRLQYRKERLEAFGSARLKAKKFLTSPVFLLLLILIVVVVFVAVRVIVARQ